MPVDALLERNALDQFLERETALLRALAFDRHGPRLALQLVREERRRLLVGPELVIVVVRGDLFPGVGLFLLGRQAQRALLDVFELAAVRRRLAGGREPRGRGEHAAARHRHTRRRSQEVAAIQIQLLVRRFGVRISAGFLISIKTRPCRCRTPGKIFPLVAL